jgi:hypothetical protein
LELFHRYEENKKRRNQKRLQGAENSLKPSMGRLPETSPHNNLQKIRDFGVGFTWPQVE